MQPPDLCPTRCAICETEGNSVELYPANFILEALQPLFFSARRVPDRIHYRIVKCSTCGLVRSDPVADSRILGQLYAQSTFDYGDEVDNLKLTYGYYLSKLNPYDVQKRTLLEVGCGNGFFLEEGLKQGYVNVWGVEPSTDAVAKANSKIRSRIICDMMRPGLFGRDQFDVLCMFQVLDHIADPASLLAECYRVLKPGGLVLCLNHNIEAISARLLRNRSPIVDIEHTFFYSPDTMQQLFSRSGFKVLRIHPVFNIYSPHYMVMLLPLPKTIKGILLKFLKKRIFRKIKLTAPLGNLYLVAKKPR
jgi:SAM-dependent methyltransferase